MRPGTYSRPEPTTKPPTRKPKSDDKKHSWPGDLIKQLIDGGYADNGFSAVGMMNLSPFGPKVEVQDAIDWAKEYRKQRDTGLEPDEAAVAAKQAMFGE